VVLPLYLKQEATLFNQQNPVPYLPNLAEQANEYIAKLTADESDLFYHTVAVLHAPAYA
jgi:hypothetical protein